MHRAPPTPFGCVSRRLASKHVARAATQIGLELPKSEGRSKRGPAVTQSSAPVLALAALQGLAVVGYLILLVVGPKSDLAGQGMAYAYGVMLVAVVGAPV